MKSTDLMEPFMLRALELAEKGRGAVHPNPLVGAVIVHDGRIVSEGYHQHFGGPHAEINAITNAKNNVQNCDLYITLEPCAHHGKTPPCVDAIIRSRFRKVIYAMNDPNPLVSGNGRRRLEDAGIEVMAGLCEEQARSLNRAYIHYQKTGLPFVTWKIAQTSDGALTLEEGRETAITGPEAKDYVDLLRAQSDAVMVGVDTVMIDDPGLRVRNKCGRDPYRIVLDSRLRTPHTAKVLTENADRKTLIVTTRPDSALDTIAVGTKENHLDLRDAMINLARRGLIEILLESGRTLGNAMVREGLVNKVIILEAPLINGAQGTFKSVESLGKDIKIIFEFTNANETKE